MSASATKIPIDVESIARSYGVQAILRRPIDADGFLVPRDDGYVIVLNSKQSPRRQRFTCAHEVAHIILGSKFGEANVLSRDRNGEDAKLEEACNQLASELLMPQEQFSKAACSAGWSVDSLGFLSSVFDTSLEATARRLTSLVPEPSVLIVWQTTADGNLKLKWQYHNPSFDARWVTFVPYRGLCDYPSLHEAHRSKGRVCGTEEFAVLATGLSRHESYIRKQIFSESIVVGHDQFRKGFSLLFPNRT